MPPTSASVRVSRTRSALRRLIEAEDQIKLAMHDYETLEENELAGACQILREGLLEAHREGAVALDKAKLAVPLVARERV